MANEYIKKQEIVEAINKDADNLEQNGAIPYAQGARAMAVVVEQMLPTEDVRRVVLCRNCKHHTYDEIFSSFWCEYPGRVRDTTSDGFCEKGEE